MSTGEAGEWTALERLALAQAIYRFGESWPTISRTLRQHPALIQQSNHFRLPRVQSFYSQKNCALEYSKLLAALEGQRKTKRSVDPTSQEIPPLMRLLRNLFTQRVEEINTAIQNDENEFSKLLAEYESIKRGEQDHRLGELQSELGLSLTAHAAQPSGTASATGTPEPGESVNGTPAAGEPAKAATEEPKQEQAEVKQEEVEQEEEAEQSTADDARAAETPAKEEADAVEEDELAESISDRLHDATPATPDARTPAQAPSTDDRKDDEDEEEAKRHKAWKKNILALLRELAAHRYAPVFLTAVKEESEPLYYRAVKQPLDLTLIKQRVQEGSLRTIDEFHRDVLHLFQNALMYNNDYHEIYEMAVEMIAELERLVADFRSAQAAIATEVEEPTSVKRSRKAGGDSPAAEPSTPVGVTTSRKRRR